MSQLLAFFIIIDSAKCSSNMSRDCPLPQHTFQSKQTNIVTLKKQKHKLFQSLAWQQSGDLPVKLAQVLLWTIDNIFLLILFSQNNKQNILLECGPKTFHCIPNALSIAMPTYRPLPGPRSFFQCQNKQRNLEFVFCSQIRATKSYRRFCTRVYVIYSVALWLQVQKHMSLSIYGFEHKNRVSSYSTLNSTWI